MGLNSTWDDSTRANEHVPPLNESFPYGSQPIRGVNLGGWLSIEPFISPSLFDKYTRSQGVIDEWTLSKQLGKSAPSTIEKHYADFIREQDYAEIRDAGLDHVRIQYSYWAIKTYDDDPYVARISWRYLLRAIEYCRKYGLRVKLDLHGLPGSQNGWNHSGRQGKIDWLAGANGHLNRQRSLELHDQLSKFFAQDRYKNVVTIYGLVNEPLMLSLPAEPVLNWTKEAARLVQRNGYSGWIVFHDGFLTLSRWYKMLQEPDRPANLMLDTHQYTIFNNDEIVVNHTKKIDIICDAWYPMIQQTNNTISGYVILKKSLLRPESIHTYTNIKNQKETNNHPNPNQLGSHDVRRMVPSRHRLRKIRQRRNRRHPLGRHNGPLLQRNPPLPNSKHPGRTPLQLRESQRRPPILLGGVQDVASHVCRGADGRLRDDAGVVLLDVADGVGGAVELSGWVVEWVSAPKGV